MSFILKHLHTVNKHRFYVFIYCVKAGIPFRGLVHDLSKYSPEEFISSCKYFSGKLSPIVMEKKDIGYSKAWLHHKGRNKHHWEYWYDEFAPEKSPIIPYKYAVEMVRDGLAASKVYNGKNWNKDLQLKYWLKTKPSRKINLKIEQFLEEVFTLCANDGIYKTLQRKKLKKLYDKHVNIAENNTEV